MQDRPVQDVLERVVGAVVAALLPAWAAAQGLRLAPDAEVRSLSMPEQQLVEIACAIGAGARIVIMDEPTASLTQKEVELLFSIVRDLRAGGVGVIYISHRLDEIFALADRIAGTGYPRERIRPIYYGYDSALFTPKQPAPKPQDPYADPPKAAPSSARNTSSAASKFFSRNKAVRASRPARAEGCGGSLVVMMTFPNLAFPARAGVGKA